MSRLQFKYPFLYQETGYKLSFIRMNGLNVLIIKISTFNPSRAGKQNS